MSAYSTAVLADSPIGYWKQDEVSGSTMADSGPNGLTGAYIGAVTFGTGQDGGAVQYPGSASVYGNVPHQAVLNFGDVFTLEAWVKPSGSGTRAIFGKDINSAELRIDASGRLDLLKCYVSDICFSTIAVPVDSNFHHVVATKNGATVKLYIDGVDVTGTVTNATIANTTSALNIGRTNNSNAYEPFPGWIDECAVYGTALSASQVLTHYQAATGTAKSGTDAGSGADSATLTFAPSSTDTGTGADSASANVVITATDTGLGTDVGTTGSPVTSSDSGTGAEGVNLARQVPDSGTGSETGSLNVPISGADTGTGTETQSVTTPAQQVASADSGTGTETASLRKTVVAQDSGYGTDTASTNWPIPPAPHNDLALTPAPHSPFVLTAAHHGSMAWGGRGIYNAFLGGLDLGHAVDGTLAILKIPETVSQDNGSGSEVQTVKSVAGGASTLDAGLGTEHYVLNAAGASFTVDDGDLFDSEFVSIRMQSADVGSVTELGTVGVPDSGLTVSDVLAGIESLRFARALADTGAGTDAATKTIKSTPVAFVAERAKGTGSYSSGGGTKSFTIPVSGVTAGNVLFVALGAGPKDAVGLNVSDDVGNTYISDFTSVLSGLRRGGFFSAQIAAVPSVITVSGTNTAGQLVQIAYKVEEFQGITAGRDGGTADTAATMENSALLPSMNVASSGQLEVGMCSMGGQASISLTGAAQAGTPLNSSPDICFFYKIGAADPTATVLVQFNSSNSTYVAIACTYVPTG